MSMSDLELLSGVNNTLHRSRRHVSFVNLWNGSLCYYPEALQPNSSVMCRFVTDSACCSFYVYYIDYLKIIFCSLNLPWHSGYVFPVCIMLLFLYGLLYMIFKYFCLPSYLTLMEMFPVSPFAYSFFYFGFCIFMPDYVALFFNCTFKDSYKASLQFAKVVGDGLHYFLVGIMALCINGYRADVTVLWCSMCFVFLGYIYLLWVVRTKYELFGRHDLVTDSTHMHSLNAWTFVFVFVCALVLVMIVSYFSLRQTKRLKPKTNTYSLDESIASEADISGKSVWVNDMSRTRIWWITVNGMKNLKEKNRIIVAILTPFYFIFANVIPVIDNNRPLHGWCKPVAIISLLVLPFISLGLKPRIHVLYTLLACSWFLAFVTCISTKSLRQPGYLWLKGYCLIGMVMYSISIHTVVGEIDNLIWQFVSMRFHPMPDMMAIHFISTGKIICMSVLLGSLIRLNKHDAAFGAVMSVLAHNTYLSLPQMVLQECYNSDIYILCTSKTFTTTVFFVAVFFATLLHVSMSGNEFRMSLFYYLLLLYISYIMFQILVYHNVIHPFGEAHNIRPPNDPRNVWA